MKRKRRILVLAMSMTLALSLLIVGLALAEITAHTLIDSFVSPNLSLTAIIPGGGGTDSTSGSVAGGLGNQRDMVLTATGSIADSDARFRISGELLRLSSEGGVTSTAKIQWDGTTDGGAASIDPDGLGSVNLEGTDNDDGFHVEIVNDDLPLTFTVRVFSTTTTAEYSVLLPGGIDFGDHVDFFIPYTVTGLSGFDFTDVGAIEVELDATLNDSVDFDMDFFEADNFRDYGDLPNSYGAAITNTGHIPHGLRLGSDVDIEENPQPSANADGDDAVGPSDRDVDDEDGVMPTPGFKWNTTDGGSVNVTVNGCFGTCYLNGWINWNSDTSGPSPDSDFGDPGERVFTDTAVTNGPQTLTFNIPDGTDTSTTYYYARFRLCANESGTGSCGSPTGEVFNGEVEDYRWGFGPTAITLSDLTARSTSRVALPLVGASLALLVLLLLYARRARRQRL